MSAILFGSISTVADTSELQRQAFNEAFAAHGLDWHWSREDYLPLLETQRRQRRIAEHAQTAGEEVDAAAIHATKSELFQQRLAASGVTPRPGVAETIAAAGEDGVKVALVTTTAPENVVRADRRARRPAASASTWSWTARASTQPKPDGAAYAFALERLGEATGGCVAIEDNVAGVASAATAGLRCVAFPNENTAGHDFEQADERVERLEYAHLPRASIA